MTTSLDTMRMSVALTYVTTESVKASFMASVVAELLYDRTRPQPLISNVIQRPGAATLARGRNNATKQFLDQTSAEWMWWLDADMTFGREVLPMMLEDARPSDGIVAARMLRLARDKVVLAWDQDSDGTILGVGMACTLVRRQTIVDVLTAHESDPWPWFGHDIENGERLEEDLTFCRRARACGWRIRGSSAFADHEKSHPLVES